MSLKVAKMGKFLSFNLLLALCVSLFFVGPAMAQEQYGNLRGVVVDKDGAPLPGVSLALESAKYGLRTAVTSEAGIFRFINITPSIYTLKCELQGFKTYLQENLDIRVGSNFDLRSSWNWPFSRRK